MVVYFAFMHFSRHTYQIYIREFCATLHACGNTGYQEPGRLGICMTLTVQYILHKYVYHYIKILVVCVCVCDRYRRGVWD